MSARMSDDSPFLTLDQAARYLHSTRSSLYQSILPKRIPHRRSGHKLLFVREELDHWLKVQTRIELARLAERQRRRTRSAAARRRKPS